jgi:hypothetical protein
MGVNGPRTAWHVAAATERPRIPGSSDRRLNEWRDMHGSMVIQTDGGLERPTANCGDDLMRVRHTVASPEAMGIT